MNQGHDVDAILFWRAAALARRCPPPRPVMEGVSDDAYRPPEATAMMGASWSAPCRPRRAAGRRRSEETQDGGLETRCLGQPEKTFPSNGLSGNRRGHVGPKSDRRTRWHEVSDAARNAREQPPRRHHVRVCDATGGLSQRGHTIDCARHAGSFSPSRPRRWRHIPLGSCRVMPFRGLTQGRGCLAEYFHNRGASVDST